MGKRQTTYSESIRTNYTRELTLLCMIEDKPLRQIIEEILPGNVICMTDFPQYNAEFVGNVLAKLVEEGLILSRDTASRE